MDQQKTSKSKIVFGVIYLFIFLFVIVGVFFLNHKNSASKDAPSKNLNGLIGVWKDKFVSFQEGLFGGKKSTDTKTILKQSLVEEESAVIDVVDKTSVAVVSVFVKSSDFDPFSGPSDPEGIGTGFIVDPKGVIITNNHVVSERDVEYSVVLKDGTSYDVYKVHRDPVDDLAILEVKPSASLPSLPLGSSENLKVGQKAIAIGNALGQYSNTVTLGVVSGLKRKVTAAGPFGNDAKTYNDVIQTDAAINPGNSGGPLLNLSGQVIGVNVATSRGAENISFSIPVDHLKPILEGFNAQGKIVRPFLGVGFSMITEDIARYRRFPEGAYVTKVGVDTPASEAGLQRGDIILKMNETPVNEKNPLDVEIQKAHKVGDKVKITVDRDTKIVILEATLGEAPEQ